MMDKLYRHNAQVGSGSTASAVRQELATRQPVGGAFHSQKAAAGDRAAAENVIRDMQNALAGH